MRAGNFSKLGKLAKQFSVSSGTGTKSFMRKAQQTVAGTPGSKVRPVIDSVKRGTATKNVWAPDGYFTEKFYKTGYFHKDRLGIGADMGKSDWEVFDMLRRDLRPNKELMKSWFGSKMPKKMRKKLLDEDFGLLDMLDY